MPIDLSGEWLKTVDRLVKKAEEFYQDRKDAMAATNYEKAGDLLIRYAHRAPSRTLENSHKNRGLKYIEYAKRLRSGDLPDTAKSGGPSGARGGGSGRVTSGGKDDNDISGAVTALVHSSNITFDEIGGLDETKNEIKYALGVGLARKPAGIQLESWRNWLFYGPPGTGKTLLAAATSNLLKATDKDRAVFFNVKVSSVMSKYFGESTRILSELYGKARDTSPSVVFLDEFESLCGSRDGGDSGTERRILSTILSELDGLSEKGREDLFVLTIAATNRPWDLDPAILSRFDKKILIPLPDIDTRRAILKILLKDRGFDLTFDVEDLLEMTEGLSGREIDRLAKEVTNRMVLEVNHEIPGMIDAGLDRVRDYEVKVRPLDLEDFEKARARVHPVTSADEMARYASWKDSSEE